MLESSIAPLKYTPGGYILESSIAASHRPVGAFP